MSDEKWYDDLSEGDGESSLEIKEYNITSTPNDFNITTLFSLIDNGVIKMPPFQRNYVWDQKRASKLIESILMGLPIPQIFLYEQEKNSFYVIDGQQRLLSIYFFMKQRFPTEEGRMVLRKYLTGDTTIDDSILKEDRYFKDFALDLPSLSNGESNKYNKLNYETLDEYRRSFDYLRTIRSVVIKQNEPDDDSSSIHEIFNRLNTGGQNLSPQEIRMSLYYSDFYKALIEINELPRWRKLLNQERIDLHFKDLEILLRGIALLFKLNEYKSPMYKFLNTFSKRATQFSEEKILYIKKLFESFLESCSEVNNKLFFSEGGKGKFTISHFEAIFIATTYEAFEKKEFVTKKLIEESVLKLKKDKDFILSNQGNVASKANVNTRINRAKRILQFK